MPPRRLGLAIAALAAMALSGGCEQLYPKTLLPVGTTVGPAPAPAEPAPSPPGPQSVEITADPPVASADPSGPGSPALGFYAPGSERFIRPGAAVTAGAAETEAGDVTLNFESTNVLEVVKVILGELLQQNYRVGPGVQGTVTLQTSRPITREVLLPTLEMLLRSNNAALVRDGPLFHIVVRDEALKGYVTPQLGDSRSRIPSGYGVRIVPLHFIGAQEMHKILEPFASPGNIVRVDSPRNLLILAGSQPELARLVETVDVFDVDWMAGMSMAMFTPDFVDVKTLAAELSRIIEDDGKGPLEGLVRLVELERVNGLLVITPRRAFLERIAQWVEKLDRDIAGVGQRLYVYHVQNGRAVEIAAVLTQVFEAAASPAKLPPAQVAPGLAPVVLSSEPARREVPGAARAGASPLRGDATVQPGPAPPSQADGAPGSPAPTPVLPTVSGTEERRSTRADEGLSLAPDAEIRIIADEVNNALLIKATAQEYKLVEAALRKLDIVPLQVLIEATIAEISLSGDFELGLEWFFKFHHGNDRTGSATLDLGAGGLAPLFPGFSYAITSATSVRAVLNALASERKVNILSSPSLMVLNNQTATINVGDEVPITTQQQQATAGVSSIVNNIEFRDTGVLLTVTPRVNAGGLVTMEIEQEVSNVAAGTANTLTPTIQQRKITSTVAIQSGQTVVLGGLIRENSNFSKGGIPGLYDIPLIGALFGSTATDRSRTELVVLITPRAVEDEDAATRITEEFRDKMQSLKPLVSPPPAGRGG